MTENYTSSYNIALEDNSSAFWPPRINYPRISTFLAYLRSKFFAAQIVLALEALHKHKIIYRE
jgi:serine/threonine protein kinase